MKFFYLSVTDLVTAIDISKDLVGTEELMKLTGPDGEIAHAEIKIGPANVMLSGEYPNYDIQSPKFYGGSSLRVHLHVHDIDSLAKRAKQMGDEIQIEPVYQTHSER